MPPTHNTLSENIRTQAVELLNKHLAAAIDLRDQPKRAHGNYGEPAFIAVHELFDKVAGVAEGCSDAIGRSEAFGEAADLFTEISRGVDHQLWLVKSHGAPQ